jgi:hypothetical protein
VTITYLGGQTLTATFTQGANSQTKTYTFTSSLAALLGGNMATVGFTSSTGGATSTQEITNWVFTPLTAPAAPTGLQSQLAGYTAASTSAVAITNQLTWTPAAGAAGYRIERKLGAGGVFTDIGGVTVPTFGDSGLVPGSTYFYRVRGTNTVGAGAYSAEFAVTTPAIPATPSAATVTVSNADSIALRWTDNANNEAGFQIFRTNGDDPLTLVASVPSNSSPSPSFVNFTDTGLTASLTYHYEIRAFNLSGFTGSAAVDGMTTLGTVTTLIATPLAATGGTPIQLTATVAPSPGAQGTVTFKDGGVALPGGVDVALSGGVAVFSTSSLAVGGHALTADYSGFGAIAASTSNVQTVTIAGAAPPPRVVRVTVNGNAPDLVGEQRSLVVGLVVEFDQRVQLDNGAFSLALHTNDVTWAGVAQPSGVGALPSDLNVLTAGNLIWYVTFAGNTEVGADGLASFKDGVYDFNIDASKVHLFDAPGIAMAASHTTTFHRLFGDSDAPVAPSGGTADAAFEATVTTGDNFRFRAAFNNDSNYQRSFDFDGDGAITTGDNLQFRTRFNKPLRWRV